MNEAELLFTQILNCNLQDLYLDREKPLDKQNSEFISTVLRRRVAGEPIQYILGKTEFMGLEFKVIPGVFIPRPETEILVETAIKIIKSQSSAKIWRIPPNFGETSPAKLAVRHNSARPRQQGWRGHQVSKLKILDIGTGSGCIAVSLAKLLPNAEVTATDVSSLALEVAKENAKLNNVDVNFIESSLFEVPDSGAVAYDLIVSNPPYISTSGIQLLQREVRYEPRVALDGGRNGLNFYRRIIKNAPENLVENGYLILEMGFTQRQCIEKIVHTSKGFSVVEIARDYNNIERVVVLKKNGSQHG
jgi:release factor glutamine methyltransferase